MDWNRGFFERMKLVALLEMRSAIEGWPDGCGPGGNPYSMFCKDELLGGLKGTAPF